MIVEGAQFGELSAGEVHRQQLAQQRVTESSDELDGFEGGEAGEGARYGSQDAETPAIPVRLFGVKAGQAGGLTGDDGGQVGFHRVHGRFDHGFAVAHAGPIQQVPFFKVEGAVQGDVGGLHQLVDVIGGDVFADRFNFDVGIQRCQGLLGFVDAGFADPVIGHEHLPIEVVPNQIAAPHQDQLANARHRQVQRRRPAESAHARDQRGRVFELELSRLAKAGKLHLATVAIEFGGGKGHGGVRV